VAEWRERLVGREREHRFKRTAEVVLGDAW